MVRCFYPFKTAVIACTACLNTINCTLCQQSVFMCFVFSHSNQRLFLYTEVSDRSLLCGLCFLWRRKHIIPRNKLFLGKVIVLPLANNFPLFSGTWKFVTVFIWDRHLSLSWARWIQCSTSGLIILRSISDTFARYCDKTLFYSLCLTVRSV